MTSLFLAFLLAQSCLAIWPLPSFSTTGNTTLWMPQQLSYTYTGPDDAATFAAGRDNSSTVSPIVLSALRRAYDTITDNTYIPWKFYPRSSGFEPSEETKGNFIKVIRLKKLSPDSSDIYGPLASDVDESYSLTVSTDGNVDIEAESSVGLAHGLTTFTQLFYLHSNGGYYTRLAPVVIRDAPKFPHRGLNLDISRHFIPISDIKRTIDALAYNKFNRLHLHATDSQSWPLEIPSMPDLAEKGAYQPDMTYSASDVADLQYYGLSRGVQVYVEVDVPGHTSSIWYSRPELVVAYGQQGWDNFAAQPPSGTLKLNSTDVYDFMDELYDDLLPRLNNYSSYFHSGGDEINKNAYELDETVGSSSVDVLRPLLQKFADKIHDQIREYGMTPIVWEEMLLEWELDLGEDVVVQTWRSDEAVLRTVEAGHKALVGNYDNWYLDCGHGQWLDFEDGTSSEQFWPFDDYCAPRKNWRQMYAYDPLEGVPENLQDLIIGGECHMWTEQTDAVNLDSVMWPRLAAAGEVLWSGAKDESGQNRSQIEASPRLADMRERLVAMGVRAGPVQMPYCTMDGARCTL